MTLHQYCRVAWSIIILESNSSKGR